MLDAPKIIDALRGRGGRRCQPVPGMTLARNRACADMLERAEKFDFGLLTLEPVEDGLLGEYSIPNLTRDERLWIAQGIVPLPAPVCWFEFELGTARSGLLIYRAQFEDCEREVMCVERLDCMIGGGMVAMYDGIRISCDFHETTDEAQFAMRVHGNEELLAHEYRKQDPTLADDKLVMAFPFAMYLLLMLSSKTSEVAIATPSRVKSKIALSHGRTPEYTHRVVRIVPKRYLDDAEREAKGTHGSPRLHWRRSHIRHYDHEVPSSKWAPTLEWKGRAGWWVTVIPRFLVGKRELGEVSHEYWVK